MRCTMRSKRQRVQFVHENVHGLKDPCSFEGWRQPMFTYTVPRDWAVATLPLRLAICLR